MALSEREQKLLEQMERALYAEDPALADVLQRGRRTPKSVAAGVALALAGVGLLFTGLTMSSPYIGVGGFIAIVAGLAVALSPRSTQQAASPLTSASASTPTAQVRRSFFDRLNERWDRRTEG